LHYTCSYRAVHGFALCHTTRPQIEPGIRATHSSSTSPREAPCDTFKRGIEDETPRMAGPPGHRDMELGQIRGTECVSSMTRCTAGMVLRRVEYEYDYDGRGRGGAIRGFCRRPDASAESGRTGPERGVAVVPSAWAASGRPRRMGGSSAPDCQGAASQPAGPQVSKTETRMYDFRVVPLWAG
jgi:hypothetical protein